MGSSKLEGRVDPGMFPNELVVTVQDFAGNDQAVIVPVELVHRYGGTGNFEVHIVERRDDLCLVRLPGELLSSGRTISVKNSQLQE